MRRRHLLVAAGAGLGAIAGGAHFSGRFDAENRSAESTGAESADAESSGTDSESGDRVEAPTLAEEGFPSTICETEITDDAIRAIVDPATAPNWRGVEIDETYLSDGADGLADDDVVIGVERDGRSRAYPLRVVWHHEIVNDDLGGPLLVSYCPICQSGSVTERVVDGEATTFHVSGQLWQPPGIWTAASEEGNRTFAATTNDTGEDLSVRNSGNLVMYDAATRSFWSQILNRAICGPMEEETLTMVFSSVDRWGDWRAEHPETDVLLPPPHSGLD